MGRCKGHASLPLQCCCSSCSASQIAEDLAAATPPKDVSATAAPQKLQTWNIYRHLLLALRLDVQTLHADGVFNMGASEQIRYVDTTGRPPGCSYCSNKDGLGYSGASGPTHRRSGLWGLGQTGGGSRKGLRWLGALRRRAGGGGQ